MTFITVMMTVLFVFFRSTTIVVIEKNKNCRHDIDDHSHVDNCNAGSGNNDSDRS